MVNLTADGLVCIVSSSLRAEKRYPEQGRVSHDRVSRCLISGSCIKLLWCHRVDVSSRRAFIVFWDGMRMLYSNSRKYMEMRLRELTVWCYCDQASLLFRSTDSAQVKQNVSINRMNQTTVFPFLIGDLIRQSRACNEHSGDHSYGRDFSPSETIYRVLLNGSFFFDLNKPIEEFGFVLQWSNVTNLKADLQPTMTSLLLSRNDSHNFLLTADRLTSYEHFHGLVLMLMRTIKCCMLLLIQKSRTLRTYCSAPFMGKIAQYGNDALSCW
jgi:hypothetical protein